MRFRGDCMNEIYASENMILTDGEIFGKILTLGDDRKASEFHEISVEEYKKIKAKQNENIENTEE